MEHYYFIDKKTTKQGPYKLSELKQQTFYSDELVWRSDNDEWKKASEFEELNNFFIRKPPPTPYEQKVTEVNKKFTNRIIGQIATSYVIISFFLGLISFSIAESSWQEFKSKEKGNYSRYKSYIPNFDNESALGDMEEFLFRPFKVFGSTIYLAKEEQNSSGTLFINLLLSSFVSLSFIFVLIGIGYYAIKRSSVEATKETVKSNEV